MPRDLCQVSFMELYSLSDFVQNELWLLPGARYIIMLFPPVNEEATMVPEAFYTKITIENLNIAMFVDVMSEVCFTCVCLFAYNTGKQLRSAI